MTQRDEMGFTWNPQPVKESTCKGQVFRGYRSMFYSNGRIELRQGVRLVKRLSCPGCEDCSDAWVVDGARDAISDDYLLMPEIEHGKLYYIAVVNESRDWESGVIDSYDLEITPLDPEVTP